MFLIFNEVRIFFQEIFQRGQVYLAHVAFKKFRGRMEIFTAGHGVFHEFFVEIFFVLVENFYVLNRRLHFFRNSLHAAEIREMPAAVDDSR